MGARKHVENALKVLFLTANKNNWKQPIDYRLERNCVTFMSCSYIDSHLSIKHNSWVKKINLQEINNNLVSFKIFMDCSSINIFLCRLRGWWRHEAGLSPAHLNHSLLYVVLKDRQWGFGARGLESGPLHTFPWLVVHCAWHKGGVQDVFVEVTQAIVSTSVSRW